MIPRSCGKKEDDEKKNMNDDGLSLIAMFAVTAIEEDSY